jgi:micrococcal nuclease
MPSLSTADFHKLYSQLLENEQNLKTLSQGANALMDVAALFMPELKPKAPDGKDAKPAGADWGANLAFVQKQIQLLQRVAYEKEAAPKASPLLSNDTFQLLMQLNQFAGLAAGFLGAKEVAKWTEAIDNLLRAPTAPTEPAPTATTPRATTPKAATTSPSIAPAPAADSAHPTQVRFTKVLDGDTSLIAGERKIRYIGIDTPEMHGADDKPEPFAVEAREHNKKFVVGQDIRLEYDAEPNDHYGRLLCYVYVGDTFVNAELVKAGLAYPLTVPPNTKHADLFKRLANEAKQAQRGLWKENS